MELGVKCNYHQLPFFHFKPKAFVDMVLNINSILFQFNLQQIPFDDKCYFLCRSGYLRLLVPVMVTIIILNEN